MVWMCDPRVALLQAREGGLETVTYFAPPAVTIASWAACLRAEEEEFSRRNYTRTAAGEKRGCSYRLSHHPLVSILCSRQRL